MRINHMNLAVSDPPQAARFFEDFFGLRRVEEKGRDALIVLLDDSGCSFLLSNFEHAANVVYPRDFHIGFIQETKDQVQVMFDRLHTAGFVEKTPQAMHGNWGFYVHAPGGILVEVSCPIDQ
jgi:lactoylglutathione lyase